MEWQVGAKFLSILGMIITAVEGFKRILSIEWIKKLLGLSEIGGGISIFLAVFGGLVIALKVYSGDGVLTSQEIWLAICEAFSAVGVYKLTLAGRDNGNNEKS